MEKKKLNGVAKMTVKLAIKTVLNTIKGETDDTTRKAKSLIIDIANSDKFKDYESFLSQLTQYYIKNRKLTTIQYKALRKIKGFK